jgi:ABC-type nitrate/sulfonate/bicarbonate transport system permease component
MTPPVAARTRVVIIRLALAVTAIVFLAVANRLYPFLPGPQAVAAAIVELVRSPGTYYHFGVTIFESFTGLLIAIILGIGLGVVVGANRGTAEFVTPVVMALYSIPKIILLPILLMVFGAGMPPKIANAALHAVFPILLNSIVGMRAVDRIHLAVARSMSARRMQIVSKVCLPTIVLPVFAGIRLGLGLAIMGALLAELFEANAGIGYVTTQFYNKGLIADMIAIVVVLFALIIAINAATGLLERRLSRWRHA